MLDEVGDGRRRKRVRQGSKVAVKLADVARLAGVSTGTVSRTLNQPHKVSAKTREAVHRAVDELGWVPHGAARALASLCTRTIGAIIPTLANANFAATIHAVQNRLSAEGYILLIGCSEYDPERALKQTRKMVERGIDGLILVGENSPPSLWRLLETQRIPYTITYGLRSQSSHPSVGIDNYRAFVRLTEFVIEQGHRQIAMIAQNPINNDRAEARLKGAKDTLLSKGIRFAEGHLIVKEWSITEGRIGLREIMAVSPAPTAVICANDYLAAGAIIQCAEMGIKVPEDVSVVGFDDLDIAMHLSPPLTTMRVPTDRLGVLTAEYLISKLEGRPLPDFIELEAELVVRESVGPPRAI